MFPRQLNEWLPESNIWQVHTMPNITVEAGSVGKETKNRLIRSLTKTASEITGIPQSSYTVLIKEFPIDNWGVGGEPLEEIFKKMKGE